MKKPVRYHRCLVLLLAVVMTGTGLAHAATVPFTSTVYVSGSTNQYDPEIESGCLVWTARNVLSLADSDIWYRDMKWPNAVNLTDPDDLHQRFPDVSLGCAVWEEELANGNKEIRAYDVWNSNAFDVAITAADEVAPRTDNGLIVYKNDDTDTLRYLRHWSANWASGQVPGASNVTHYDVDNGRIVWAEALVEAQVRMWRPELAGATSTLLYTAPSGSDVDSVQIHGDRVAITLSGTNSDVLYIDIRTKAVTNVNPGSAYNESGLIVFGPDRVWQTDQGGTFDLLFKAYGFDIQNIAGTGSEETDPSMFGRRVVYEHDVAQFNKDIYMKAGAVATHRTAGTDRYATAVAASRRYFSVADNAILCTGTDFPDALSATPLARALAGPILLTAKDRLNAKTEEELERLGVKNVYIIGGTAVVSSAVQNALTSAGYHVMRIAGANRYETSAEVAYELADLTADSFGIDSAFFTRGDNFPDALAVGPVAAGALSPVLLVQTDSLPSPIHEVIDTLNLKTGYIIGGENVISSSVENRIFAALLSARTYRWAGTNRYETAVSVVSNGIKNRFVDMDTLGVAVGTNFPDALGGGAALAYYGSPLILTPSGSVPGCVTTFLDEHKYEIGSLDVFGGTDVVSDSVKSTIASKLK